MAVKGVEGVVGMAYKKHGGSVRLSSGIESPRLHSIQAYLKIRQMIHRIIQLDLSYRAV